MKLGFVKILTFFLDKRQKRGYNCSKKGFQSVDEFPDLLEAYPVKRVMYQVTILMELRADAHPSLLGRAPRKQIFGIDGLTDDMMTVRTLQSEMKSRWIKN